jgi:leucyl aminopeptidase
MPLTLTVRRADPSSLDAPLLIVVLDANAPLPPALASLDARLDGAIARSLSRRDFRAARDEMLHLTGVRADGPGRVLLVGLGAAPDRTAALRRAAMIAARQAHRLGVGSAAWFAGSLDDSAVEATVVGLSAGAWEYTDVRTAPPPEERRAPLTEVVLLVDDEARARQALANGLAIAAGHALARRLAMMPGNLCTPEFLSATGRDLARRHQMAVTVLGRAEMEAARMGAFLAVAQGTPQEPQLVCIEYRRGAPDAKPIVLVGKGLCFDSGGISIKPAQGMEFMKFDMCGAAGVLGALETIAQLGLRTNVIGIIGATTNMPSGTAIKPGDVVQSHLGKYIEIINTDAEGRLVLADLLSYARQFDPSAVLDAATLTGACVVALGHTATGVFGPDESLVNEVVAAAKRGGEPAWPLPVWDEYRELIKSDVADIKNSGGRAAGAISAAMFLKEFTASYPWVHLDVAGTAYSESDLPTLPKGPTGVPVSTFVEFVRGRSR